MKKERIKDLLNLEEDSLRLDEYKDKNPKPKNKKGKGKNNGNSSKKDPETKEEPKKEEPKPEEKSKAEEPKKEDPKEETKPEEKTPADEKDTTKKVWQNVLTMIWNNHPNKNKQDVLKDTLIDVLKAMDWDRRHGKKNDAESETTEGAPNAKGEGDE